MISIITPVLEGERHIEGCLHNVLEQDCAECEHIIVDGGSKDSTVEIVRRFAEQHRRVRWISEPDRGQSDAMNKGTALARGKIIGVLNVDDFYEPGVLNRVAGLFRGRPEPSLLVGNCKLWDANGRLIRVDKPSNLNLFDMLIGMTGHPLNPASYFYHKSLHDGVGGYDLNEHQALDLDFLLKARRIGHAFYFDEDWGNWRLLPDAKTYASEAAGMIEPKIESLRRLHRARLPQPTRAAAEIAARLCRRRWARSVYFHSKHPIIGAKKLRDLARSLATR